MHPVKRSRIEIAIVIAVEPDRGKFRFLPVAARGACQRALPGRALFLPQPAGEVDETLYSRVVQRAEGERRPAAVGLAQHQYIAFVPVLFPGAMIPSGLNVL